MKNYNEIAQSVLERRDEYIIEQKTRRKKLTAAVSVAASLVIVAVIGVGVSENIRFEMPGEGTDVTGNKFAELIETTEPANQQGELQTSPTETTFPAIQQSDIYQTSPIATTSPISTTVAELYYELDWDRRSMPGKYRAVILEGIEYVYPFRVSEEHATSRKATEIISNKQIEGYEPDGTEHTTIVDIFALEGISEELAIGVRFEKDERIYTYVNNSYVPNTLGEFLDAIDYDNTVTYGGIMLYPGNNFPVNEKNAADIKKYLLSDASLVNIQDIAVTGKSVTASIYCRELGRENKGFNICEDGYISTNLIGYEYVFFVGKEAVATFLKDSYNITFEQIKEVTAVTMNTTQAPTTEDVRTSSAWSGALPNNDSADMEIDATVTWWCGTGMEENNNLVVGTTQETVSE